ncbi:MAG: hypothetical protein JWP73_1044 [Phenylobacterium sp.]|nr:hypothetical protein [Phenylobacterium sp.]
MVRAASAGLPKQRCATITSMAARPLQWRFLKGSTSTQSTGGPDSDANSAQQSRVGDVREGAKKWLLMPFSTTARVMRSTARSASKKQSGWSISARFFRSASHPLLTFQRAALGRPAEASGFRSAPKDRSRPKADIATIRVTQITSSDPLGGGMDIHKPKPWHGLREFLKEYAIIVLGVLTALGAEQVVGNLHERRLSDEARMAVRSEIDLDLANATRFRGPQQVCLDARLREIAAVLDRAGKHRAFQPLYYIGQPITGAVYTQKWDAARSSGRASLMSSDEQRGFARVYQQLHYLEESASREDGTWSHLSALEGQDELSPEQIARAREALGEARQESDRIRGSLALATAFARRLGIRGTSIPLDPIGKEPTIRLCIPSSKTP